MTQQRCTLCQHQRVTRGAVNCPRKKAVVQGTVGKEMALRLGSMHVWNLAQICSFTWTHGNYILLVLCFRSWKAGVSPVLPSSAWGQRRAEETLVSIQVLYMASCSTNTSMFISTLFKLVSPSHSVGPALIPAGCWVQLHLCSLFSLCHILYFQPSIYLHVGSRGLRIRVKAKWTR